MTFALSTLDTLDAALSQARSLTISAYRLPPAMERELEAAAARGVSVDVALARAPAGTYDGGLAAGNAAAAERLRAAGVRTSLVDGAHLKAAVVDGVAYLDDRNFARRGPSNVVRDDDAGDVARITSAILAADDAANAPRGGLALDKASALALEAAVLSRGAADGVAISTETFGYGEISSAIRKRLDAGERVRLLVDRREAADAREAGVLARMAAIGVEVRTGDGVDKVAIAGPSAWLGSANATYAGPNVRPQSDWGATTADAATAGELRARFERTWSAAKPFVPAGAIAGPANDGARNVSECRFGVGTANAAAN